MRYYLPYLPALRILGVEDEDRGLVEVMISVELVFVDQCDVSEGLWVFCC